MKVDVVIPTCDGRNSLLAETLDSVANQSRLPDTVWVIYNGRNGNEQSEELGNRVKWVDAWSRMGASQARNLGVFLSDADYIAFCDDDDLWGGDYLETIMGSAEESQADLLVGRLDQLKDGRIDRFKNCEGGLTVERLLRDNPGVSGSCLTVRRESFLEVGGFDPILSASEDRSLVIDFILRGKDVESVPSAQAIIRRHDQARLSRSKIGVLGRRNFYAKYTDLMDDAQRAALRGRNAMKANRAGDRSFFVNWAEYLWCQLRVTWQACLKGKGRDI